MAEDYASGGIIRKVTVAIDEGGCILPTPTNDAPLYCIKAGKTRKHVKVMQSGLVKVLAPLADLSGYAEILVDLAQPYPLPTWSQ